MYTNTILESIDDSVFKSEIDTLISITESYQKLLTMLCASDCDETVIQETFSLYMEDGESGSVIKNLFKKVIAFFKSVISKIKGLFQRCIEKNRVKYIQSYNILMIADELNKIFSSKVFNEYMSGEISDEVFQEALFDKKSEQEKEEEQYNKASIEREKAYNKEAKRHEKELEKNVKANEEQLQKFVKTLRSKVYCDDKFTRMLSRNDVENIVKVTCLGASKEELNKLRNAVKQITNGENMQGIDKNTYHTLDLIVSTGKAVGDANAVKKSKAISDADRAITQKRLSKDNTAKMEYDITLLDKFAETFGTGLSHLSGRDYFSTDNLKTLVYGPNKVANVAKTAAMFTTSTVFNLVTRAAYSLAIFKPKAIYNDIAEFGAEMDKLDNEFGEFIDNDTVLRKEFGIKLNNSMNPGRSGKFADIATMNFRGDL